MAPYHCHALGSSVSALSCYSVLVSLGHQHLLHLFRSTPSDGPLSCTIGFLKPLIIFQKLAPHSFPSGSRAPQRGTEGRMALSFQTFCAFKCLAILLFTSSLNPHPSRNWCHLNLLLFQDLSR